MNELIDVVNRLQDVFLAGDCPDMDLPQIVVVGTQSAGKSSVLEHIVGRSFLPRGAGVVTRCPLVLQLVHSRGKEQEYAIFQHNKTKVFTDYRLISREIEEQTARVAGPNKDICQSSINLKIFSSSVPNLTLVDLPGLTKVPVGDQPLNIEEQTRKLTLKYIDKPDCIILAVTPANADMATSESIKIAKQVDPDGVRTLAVITKVDLMDEGTDAWDMLTGKVIPVKLGIIGVINRSQKDIKDDKSIKDSLIDEAEFFRRNYKSIAAISGSPYLTKTVQSLLVSHIKNCIPRLKDRVGQDLSNKRMELLQLGDGKLDKPTLLLDLMTKFSSTYISAIKGNLTDIKTKELYGGARIKYVFQECLSTALKSIDALAGLTKTDILTAMENASGVTHTIFVSEVAFELLVKRQIGRMRDPCLQCVDLICEELKMLVQCCLEDVNLRLDRFPRLQREIDDLVAELLQSRLPITNQMVEHHIDNELSYINTAHPDFLPNSVQGLSLAMINGGRTDYCNKNVLISRKKSLTMMGLHSDLPLNNQGTQSQLSNQDKSSCDYTLIQELILSYFSIVRKTTQDMIPKIIMNFLVNFVVEHLQLEMVARLYKSDAEDLLRESQATVEKRKEIKSRIAALEQATLIINENCPSIGRGGKGDFKNLKNMTKI